MFGSFGFVSVRWLLQELIAGCILGFRAPAFPVRLRVLAGSVRAVRFAVRGSVFCLSCSLNPTRSLLSRHSQLEVVLGFGFIKP